MDENVILSKIELSFLYNSSFGACVSSVNNPAFSLVSGQQYRIIWDDVEYARTAFAFTSADGSQCVGVGNPLAAGQTANDDKFCIVYDDTNKIVHYLSLEQTASHEVAIYQIIEGEEEPAKQDGIVLKNRDGNPVTYPGIKCIHVLSSEDGELVTFAAVSSGQVTASVLFMDYDGTTLFSRHVFIGDACPDPVEHDKITEPTGKENTDKYSFGAWCGWGLSPDADADPEILLNVSGDMVVYAIYEKELRYYTVNFYDGNTIIDTQQIAYGETANPPNTDREGYTFVGWDSYDFVITEDRDFYGTWEVEAPSDIVPLQTITTANDTSSSGAYKGKISVNAKLETGKTYCIEFNGVTYTCVCRDVKYTVSSLSGASFGRTATVGNARIITKMMGYSATASVSATSEPFFIYNDIATVIVVYTKTAITTQVRIYEA